MENTLTEYRTVAGGVDANATTLHGQVTPFNSATVIGDLRNGGFREQVAPGAFTKTIGERDIVLLFNHNTDMPLARTSAGNLTLRAGANGLEMNATPVDTSYGKDLMKLARAGVVKGMSFGFEVVKDAWTDDAGNPANSASGTNRTIHEVKLHEVSAVTFPAYSGDGQTTLSARDQINAARESRLADVITGYVRPDAEGLNPKKTWFRDKYNAADRKKMAASGHALPDGSFPIADADDLANAIHLAGNAKDPAAARRHIIASAKRLGLSAKIPDSWKADGSNSMTPGNEVRDVQDGDDPNGEFYNIWAHGAIWDLKQNLDNVNPNLKMAFNQIQDYLASVCETQSADDGKSEVSEDGAAPATGMGTPERSDDEEAWLIKAQVAIVEAQRRALDF